MNSALNSADLFAAIRTEKFFLCSFEMNWIENARNKQIHLFLSLDSSMLYAQVVANRDFATFIIIGFSKYIAP